MIPYERFLLVYGTAFVGTELLLGAVFAARAVSESSQRLALLASAYAWSAPLAILNVLGLLGVHIIGQSPQSIPAVWTLWHLGWPILMCAYAFSSERTVPHAFRYPAAIFVASLVTGIGVYRFGFLLPEFVTAGGNFPPLITKLTIGTAAVVVAAALVRLLRRESPLDRWVALGVGFVFLELCIAFASPSRYSVQFFTARLISFCGAVAILVGVIVDTLAKIRRATQHAVRLETEMAHQRKVADALQRAALPPSLPELSEVRLTAMYRPAHSEARVGGDWYDAFQLSDGRLVITIGDVMGSGLEAAITMNAVRQSIRGAAEVVSNPVSLLDAADRALRKSDDGKIVTAFIGILDVKSGALSYASAGHPPPLLRRADGRLASLEHTGTPLGLRHLDSASKEKAGEASLEPNDLLFLYTDGLTEADHDGLEGEARLRELVGRSSDASAESIYEGAIALTRSGTASDDVAILMACMKSVPSATSDPAPAAATEPEKIRR